MEEEQGAPSYAQLLRVPGFLALFSSALLTRTALAMSMVAFVLFALERFHSPGIAGLAVFLLIFPGLAMSPLNGAMLDRFGRTRLMMLDFAVAAAGVLLVALLARVGVLGVASMLLIVGLTSLTNTLSSAGTRSLFPLVVPRRLWERANAADVLCYGGSAIVGPALAGGFTAWLGGPGALTAVAVLYIAGALPLLTVREPVLQRADTTQLVREALRGLGYVVRNPTLRWLAVSMFVFNVGWGIVTVALPLAVFAVHGNAGIVGAVFAVEGATGVPAALLGGRLDTRGRERALMALCFAVIGVATLVLLLPAIAAFAAVFAVVGICNGPLNVALFSLRQRRTPPAWFGRAFAISISLNYAGTPLGAALGGPLAAHSLTAAFVLAGALPLLAALLVWRIPGAGSEAAG